MYPNVRDRTPPSRSPDVQSRPRPPQTSDVLADLMTALAGCRVLDFSRLAPGPMATMILADLGADVIKVEEPGGGRRARDERKVKGGDPRKTIEDEARWRTFNPLERNKRSIAVDLKAAAGREVVLRLAAASDVVVEGFRPGVAERLGISYDDVRLIRPDVIYCSITGYGRSGPRKRRTGHDLNYLAYAGALSLIAGPQNSAVVPTNVIGDYAGGSLYAAIAILAALLSRERTGTGQFIDLSMAEGVVALLAVEIARLFNTGSAPTAGTTYLTGGAAYYNVYTAKDGRRLTIACNEPHFFATLCDLLDVPEMVERQFDGPAGQNANYVALQERFAKRTLQEWASMFDEVDVPFEPVRSLAEVVQDRDLWSRGMFVRLSHDLFGAVTQVGSPLHLAATPPTVRKLSPMPGENAAAILEEAGYSDTDAKRLIANGVITLPALPERPKAS